MVQPQNSVARHAVVRSEMKRPTGRPLPHVYSSPRRGTRHGRSASSIPLLRAIETARRPSGKYNTRAKGSPELRANTHWHCAGRLTACEFLTVNRRANKHWHPGLTRRDAHSRQQDRQTIDVSGAAPDVAASKSTEAAAGEASIGRPMSQSTGERTAADGLKSRGNAEAHTAVGRCPQGSSACPKRSRGLAGRVVFPT